MATIDNLTKEFISAYTVANKDEMHRLSKSIIREIKRDTYQFKKVEHPYIVLQKRCTIYGILIVLTQFLTVMDVIL